MSSRVRASLAVVPLLLISPAPAAADVPLPTGSYLQSCKVVSFDAASGDLAAACDGPAVGMFGLGTPDTSRMNIRGCKEGSIWNDQRQLYCFAESAWGEGRVIPPGSYIESCTDRQVVGGALLTARCDNGNGVSVNASLDLRPCNWGKDISNSGGRLTCGVTLQPNFPAFTGGANQGTSNTVVKPVSVEPGAVKPVEVAPAAPEPGDSTAPGESRKHKRRVPGERG